MRARVQVSLPYALPPLSFSTCPVSSIDFRSEGPLMTEDPAPFWTGKELTDRRTSFVQRPATTADLLDAM
jgi:hypothetical protein